jgi:hypothetical protein
VCDERAVLADLVDDFVELGRIGGLDFDAGMAAVGTTLADVDFEDSKVTTKGDDIVEDVGQHQRVDDMPFER